MADIDLQTARKSPTRPRSVAAERASDLPGWLDKSTARGASARRLAASVDKAKAIVDLAPRRDAS